MAGTVNDPPARSQEANAAMYLVRLLEWAVSNLGGDGAAVKHTLSRNAVISDSGRSDPSG